MDFAVTIEAALAQQKLGGQAAGETALVLRQTRVTRLRMTALAEQGCPHAEHCRLIRAMRVMAITTVFRNGCVLPKVRSALLRVARKTGLVGGLLDEQQVAVFAVRAVAVATAHLVLTNRVCIRLHRLCALLLMAVEANLGFC